MLPDRRQWWRMSPHTSSVLRPTRSGLRVRRPPEARVRAPAGSSAVGSADSFRMRFANSSWRISGCETRSAGRCSTVDGRDGYAPNIPAPSQSDLHVLQRVPGLGAALETFPNFDAPCYLLQVRGIQTVTAAVLRPGAHDMKARQDGTLLVPGSGALVRWTLANDLVDQLDLLTYPVVIGQGTRLFPDSGPDVALALVNSRTTSRGITIQTYRPLGRPEYVTSTVDPEHVMRDATSGRRS